MGDNPQKEEGQEELPFWQVNVPLPLRTAECPPFLQNVNPKDKIILSTPDTAYHTLTWPEVRHLISTNRIDIFQRRPSDLRRYLEYMYNLSQKYGSVIDFVLKERLGWKEDEIGGEMKGERWGEGNVKVLWNDWPYGIDGKIVHLVVWTKFLLEEVEGTDRLLPEVGKEIEEFVKKTFVEDGGMKPENVIWFKNWKSLKSVHAVEHFHVMLYDPDLGFLDRLTGGDQPRSRRVKKEGEF